ncbi:hypothetical protein GCM10022323_16270 [Asaccharospora irregularis DSM 2635]
MYANKDVIVYKDRVEVIVYGDHVELIFNVVFSFVDNEITDNLHITTKKEKIK